MAQAQLNASVVLFGRVDNSIGQLGAALVSIGGTIDQMSRKLIDFGKESAQVYRDYEDSMLDAQVALSTIYGRNTRELSGVMKNLTAQTTEWAATTIFHTNDVADAVAKAAHAGWDEQKILSGIPAAMELAQAGGLDLSQSVDYIIKSTNAAGISFGDLTDFIDEWTFAANRSAGDVESFGEAMTRMGSTMRFSGSRQELLTMLAVLHDAGTTGSDAGTLLRNSMIRLVAPTQKASEAMAELGLTQADIDEAMGEVEGDTAGAVAKLEELGFSAYDSQGNLKDFLTIFRELGAATAEMSDEDKYDIWSAIFPTRTITGAMALMNAAMGEGFELYDLLTGGAATGYGEYASETMMSGMTGAIETLTSKWERLQQVTGANLAPQIEEIAVGLGKVIDALAAGGADNNVGAGLDFVADAATWLGSMADNLGDMDPAMFDAMSSALGVVAGMGPALLLTGGALRLIGTLFSNKMGMIMLGAMAVISLSEAIKAFQEAKFQEAFGTMDMDTAPLIERLGVIEGNFRNATEGITGFSAALGEAVDAYDTAAADLSSELLNSMLLGTEYSDPEHNPLIDNVKGLVEKALETLDISSDSQANYLTWLFGEDFENQALIDYAGLLAADKAKQEEEMRGIGEDLRKALVSALSNDGVVDQEEYDKIKQYMDALADAETRAAMEAKQEEGLIEAEMLRRKMSSLSYAAASEYIQDTVLPQRDAEAARLQDEYDRQMATISVKARKQGWSQEEIDRHEAAANAQHQQRMYELVYSQYDSMIYDAMFAAIRGSDFGETDRIWTELVHGAQSGESNWRYAQNVMDSQWGGNYHELMRLYGETIEYLGGEEAVRDRIDYYNGIGDTRRAAEMQDVLDKYAYGRYNLTYGERENERYYGKVNETPYKQDLIPEMLAYARDLTENLGITDTSYASVPFELISDMWDAPQYETLVQSLQGLGADAAELMNKLAPFRENDPVANLLLSAYESGLGAGGRTASEEAQHVIVEELPAEPELLPQAKDMLPALTAYAMDLADGLGVKPDVYGNVPWERTGNLANTPEFAELVGIMRTADAEMTALVQALGPYRGDPIANMFLSAYDQANISSGNAAEAGAEMKTTIEGELNPIDAEVGFPNAASEGSAARSAIEQYFSTPITQYVQVATSGLGSIFPSRMMAKGGRETQPAIFAEAGPEWFIPEAHTRNTAALLLGAARASGFSLAELAAMGGASLFADGGVYGGALDWGELSDDGGSGSGSSFQVQYSPVIHADNAEGVESVLLADKKRLEKWFNEWWNRKELYESVVDYQ